MLRDITSFVDFQFLRHWSPVKLQYKITYSSKTCLERPLLWETTCLERHISLSENLTFRCNWTGHQRPSVLRDRIFTANEAVLQNRFHCIYELKFFWFSFISYLSLHVPTNNGDIKAAFHHSRIILQFQCVFPRVSTDSLPDNQIGFVIGRLEIHVRHFSSCYHCYETDTPTYRGWEDHVGIFKIRLFN